VNLPKLIDKSHPVLAHIGWADWCIEKVCP
jgi:hypothetical protein